MCVCISLWGCEVHEVQKREGFRPLELEFQVDVSCPIRALRLSPDSPQEQFTLLLMSYLSSSWASTF